jgi:anti-sigma B factor antagonist
MWRGPTGQRRLSFVSPPKANGEHVPPTDTQPATFGCRAQEIAAGVWRVWVTGHVDPPAALEVGRTLRTTQEAAAVTMLDVRAASLTPALRDLLETADERAVTNRRRLVILEQPAAGAGSELAALGLRAKLMTITESEERLFAGAAFPPPAAPSRRGERVVVDVQGALDIAIGPELEAELAAHAALGRSLVLDLRAVEFMDSTGIRILIDAFDRARDRGLGFELLSSDAVDRTLEVAHLRDYFEPLPALADRNRDAA